MGYDGPEVPPAGRGHSRAASPRRLQARILPALTFRAGASPASRSRAPAEGPAARGGAGRGRRRRRSWSYFVGQPWSRLLLHQSAGESAGRPPGGPERPMGPV